ncbi:LacI family DNA-binding transcriptional regulator [Paenibacillus ihumii]|uniref:LacI family DNA-binding transcriptional regulator n=1 Tax=Paenibacillus ihumii TaxID=687436 RepID=UPI0006D8182A|nr:LacI family DNA-binding transcriptional regulator [Paenibacillus ihumii]
MPTLKDIAQMVGVSISTVSRVINEDTSKHISAETKAKVWEAVKQLNYKTSDTQRRLIKQKMVASLHSDKQIGCILSFPNNKHNDPFFSPMLAGIKDKLKEMGASLAFIKTQDEVIEEWQQNRLFEDGAPEGLIIIENVNPSLVEALKERVPFCVGIDLTDPTLPVIVYDRVIAAKAAVSHLIDQGYRKIGYIGGIDLVDSADKDMRFQGYKTALLEADLPINSQWIINAEWDVDISYDKMSELLTQYRNDLPTAMFCASDMMAIAAMRAVSEQGLRIPDDIAFIGLDNIEVSKYTSPPLSTIHIPKYEMGLVAAKTVIDFIDGCYPIPFKMVLPFELIVRQSSGELHREGSGLQKSNS